MKRVSLKEYNTFGIDCLAHSMIEIDTVDTLMEWYANNPSHPKMILGGGSNILLVGDIDRPVLRMTNNAIDVIAEDHETLILKVGAGMEWHKFVLWSVDHGYGGIENLALIPGSVGASPIQNIGAYGVEVRDTIERVEFLDFGDGKLKSIENKQCNFGYRNSIFKNKLKDQICITNVTYRLKKENYSPRIGYSGLKEELEDNTQFGLKDIFGAVCKIRQRKLPDVSVMGSAGSFFKNPIISYDEFNELSERYPNIPHYPLDDKVKLPAGWLIEMAGWKGKRIGDVGCYENQALVIVNHGNATGHEILAFANDIKSSISDAFNIDLTFEVNIIQ